jgi:hypothetical protein
MLIAAIGIIDLIWTEVAVSLPSGLGPTGATYRWQLATGPIELFAVGVLIAAVAQILAVISRSN